MPAKYQAIFVTITNRHVRMNPIDITKRGSFMKNGSHFILAGALLLGSSVVARGDNVRTDYNHQVNFSQYHTYCWGKVQTTDPFFASRIQEAVDKQLQSKGWQLTTTGCSVSVFATDNLHNQQETQTMYDGMGGGWGGGWGWGGWGWRGGWADPGFGTATTTTSNQTMSNLVIDLFDGNSKSLLWRGLATADLSTNASKNTNSLNNDIAKMFKGFPPKAGK
jgi:Domain of unknown function (DUF4136)